MIRSKIELVLYFSSFPYYSTNIITCPEIPPKFLCIQYSTINAFTTPHHTTPHHTTPHHTTPHHTTPHHTTPHHTTPHHTTPHHTTPHHTTPHHTTPHHTTPHHTTPHHTTPHHTTPHHTTPHHTTPHHTTHHTRYLYMQGCHKCVLTSMSTVMQYADKQEYVYTNLSRSFRNPIEYFSDSHASSLRTSSIYVRRNALQPSMRLETQKVSMRYNFYVQKLQIKSMFYKLCLLSAFPVVFVFLDQFPIPAREKVFICRS